MSISLIPHSVLAGTINILLFYLLYSPHFIECNDCSNIGEGL